MKTTLVFLLVVAAMYAVDARTLRKRFFVKDIQKAYDKARDFVGERIEEAKDFVGEKIEDAKDFVGDTIENAKDALKDLASGGSFEDAVDRLKERIDSDTTVEACERVCTAYSEAILGRLGAVGGYFTCPHLCERALEELKEALS